MSAEPCCCRLANPQSTFMNSPSPAATLVFAVSFVLAILVPVIGCPGGPTNLEPRTSLEVRDAALNTQWGEKSEELSQTLNELMLKLAEREATVDQISTVNKAFTVQHQLDRLALRLMELREPAGVDFHLRAGASQAKLKEISAKIKADGEFQKVLNKMGREYLAEARKREKALGKVRGLARQGEWNEAEEALNGLQDELEVGRLWFEQAVFSPALKPFSDARSEINENVRRLYRDSNSESLRAALGQGRPDVTGEVDSLRLASSTLRTSPKAGYFSASLSGPEIVKQALQRCSELQQSVIRYETLHWYDRNARDSIIEQQYEAYRGQLVSLLADVIAADAERAGSEDLRPLYLAYLNVLSPVVARAFDETIEETLTHALDPLLAKSPELRAEVTGYEQATDGVLAWRRRTAEAYAKARRKEFPSMGEVYTTASRGIAPLRGLFSNQRMGSLYDPADQLMEAVAPLLLGKKVSLTGVDASRAGEQPTTSRLQGGSFARLQVARLPPAAVDQLKADLFVREGHGPMTLRAASAIWAVENGCVEEIGAEITALQFSALAPTALRVTGTDAHLVHLSQIATQEFIEPEKQVVTQFDVYPVWYRFKYQFVVQ